MALLPEDMGCAGTDPAGDMAVQRISERREKEKVKKEKAVFLSQLFLCVEKQLIRFCIAKPLF